MSVLITLLAALAAAPQVEVAPLSSLAEGTARSARAEVISHAHATLSAQVSAEVTALPQLPGASVSEGALLVGLDPAQYRLAVSEIEARIASTSARIEQAEARLKRGNELSEKAYISADDLLDRETAVTALRADRVALQAALARARLDLERTRITAPYDGVVVERHVSVGELAQPGAPLITLVAAAQREVTAALSPGQLGSIRQAQSLVFRALDQDYPVRVARISSVADPAARTRRVWFELSAEAPPVGTAGEVRWRDQTPFVPAAHIVRRGGALGVFVLEGDRVRFHPLAQAQEGRDAPATGLPGDALIVVSGAQALNDGDSVDTGS